jgi:hypothetical protein
LAGRSETKIARGKFCHFSRLSKWVESWQVDRKSKIVPGQFRHFSRRCRNGLKFGWLIGNKNRAGAIRSFFATVSKWAEIWQIDQKQKSRRGQFRYFSRLCRNELKFG